MVSKKLIEEQKPLSRQKKIKPQLDAEGNRIDYIYCRKCKQSKRPNSFFTATDHFLDSNGFMSICKDCCEDIYKRAYLNERSMDRALYRVCKLLNIKFDSTAVRATEEQLSKKDGDIAGSGDNVVGFYKSKIRFSDKRDVSRVGSADSMDLTFDAGENPLAELPKVEYVGDDYLKQFWGDGLTFEDYSFLEKELSEWISDRGDMNTAKPSMSLLKDICHLELNIRKKRVLGESVGNLVKEKQELMKTSALSPAQSNAVNQGRNKDAWGTWSRDIEQYEPLEWWKDHSVFKDVDGILETWKTHLLRPFLNFWGLQKDFNFDGAVETTFEDNSIEEDSKKEE